jgi:hypothetical protein
VPHSRPYNNITQSWTRFPVRSTLALNQEHILRCPQVVPRAVDHEDGILDVFILPRRGEAGKMCSSGLLLRQSFASIRALDETYCGAGFTE